MRLILYTRVSTHEQAAGGISLTAQEAQLRGWCNLLGHTVHSLQVDAGVSAKISPGQRPAFLRVMGHLEKHEADGVVAVRLDRFSRSVIDTLNLITGFDKKGWRVLSLHESLDTSTPTGKFTVTILAAMAEWERGMISQRTREGIAQLKSSGKRWGKSLPWGKQLGADKKTLEDCPIEIEAMDRVTALVKSGMTNEDYIAAALNEWHPHPRINEPWTQSRVHTLFKAMRAQGKRPESPKYRLNKRRPRKPVVP